MIEFCAAHQDQSLPLYWVDEERRLFRLGDTTYRIDEEAVDMVPYSVRLPPVPYLDPPPLVQVHDVGEGWYHFREADSEGETLWTWLAVQFYSTLEGPRCRVHFASCYPRHSSGVQQGQQGPVRRTMPWQIGARNLDFGGVT